MVNCEDKRPIKVVYCCFLALTIGMIIKIIFGSQIIRKITEVRRLCVTSWKLALEILYCLWKKVIRCQRVAVINIFLQLFTLSYDVYTNQFLYQGCCYRIFLLLSIEYFSGFFYQSYGTFYWENSAITYFILSISPNECLWKKK